jgi:hypothetical protein
MRGKRDLQPAAQGIAVDRCNDRLGTSIEDLVRTPARDRRRAVGAELADVGAGDEAAPGADQHHRLDRRVGVAALDMLDDALGHPRAQRIDGRVVNCDDPDPIHIFETNQLVFRHFEFLPSEARRGSHISAKPAS